MEVLISIAGTIAGVFIGWRLSRSTAREVAHEERQWQEGQTIRQRQEVAAEALREAVIEVQRVAPGRVMAPREAAQAMTEAHTLLRGAWTRASLLRDDGIDRCFYAIDMAMFIAGQDCHGPGDVAELNFWPLSVGLAELRQALDAYLSKSSMGSANPEVLCRLI